MKFLLILLFALPVFSQPTFGDLSEIKGKTAYYVLADDPRVRKEIEKQVGLNPQSDPEKAEIFVEYLVLSREPSRTIFGDMEKAELRVYYYRDNKQIVVWSESGVGAPNTARKLAKKLRSALKTS